MYALTLSQVTLGDPRQFHALMFLMFQLSDELVSGEPALHTLAHISLGTPNLPAMVCCMPSSGHCRQQHRKALVARVVPLPLLLLLAEPAGPLKTAVPDQLIGCLF